MSADEIITLIERLERIERLLLDQKSIKEGIPPMKRQPSSDEPASLCASGAATAASGRRSAATGGASRPSG